MIISGRDLQTGRRMAVSLSEVDADDRAVITDITLSDDLLRDDPVRDGRPGEGDLWLAPGLIDLQVNGYAGHDVNADSPSWEAIAAITEELATLGVTSWLPTVITAAPEQIMERLAAVRQARREDPATARAVLGVHLEGPFLSPSDGARGVHDPALIRPVDLAEVDRWLTDDLVTMITVSPHRDDTIAAIPVLVERGLVVAVGHTDATSEQIAAAAAAGASVSTHLGNGVPAMLPRHPNVIWSQLADDRLSAGLIADGHHLPVDVLEVALRAKPAGRAFLVSDSTALAGSAPGRYASPVGGTVEVSADGRLSYLGTALLAGAALPVSAGLVTVVGRTSLSLPRAVDLATANPARLLPNAPSGLGTLTVGAPADLVWLDDDGAVRGVVPNGRRRSRSLP